MTPEMEQEMSTMCNLSLNISEEALNRGLAQGRKEGRAEGRLAGLNETALRLNNTHQVSHPIRSSEPPNTQVRATCFFV